MTRAAAITTATARFERGEFTRDLAALVAIPSESQTPEGAPHLRAYLDHITPRLRAMGFTTEIIDNPLPGAPPLLLGERIEATELPTILTYGHGDVTRAQTDAWAEGLAPFVLTERGEKLYGRGAADNKVQHLVNLTALESVLATRGHLGFNVKIVLEMGEETGSPGLAETFHRHKAPDQTNGHCNRKADTKSRGPHLRKNQATEEYGTPGHKCLNEVFHRRVIPVASILKCSSTH